MYTFSLIDTIKNFEHVVYRLKPISLLSVSFTYLYLLYVLLDYEIFVDLFFYYFHSIFFNISKLIFSFISSAIESYE
jgi:hypothetical protein